MITRKIQPPAQEESRTVPGRKRVKQADQPEKAGQLPPAREKQRQFAGSERAGQFTGPESRRGPFQTGALKPSPVLEVLRRLQVLFNAKPLPFIGLVAGLAGIIALFISIAVYIDHRIDSRIGSKIGAFQELTAAFGSYQAGYFYDSARSLNNLYYSFKRAENRAVLMSLTSVLLDSIAQSGFPEEFLNTIEAIQKDNMVPLRRHLLNQIASIYLDCGQLDKAESTLNRACLQTETVGVVTQPIEATSYWLLAQLYLTRSNIDGAVSAFLQAARLQPETYRRENLTFCTTEQASRFIGNSKHWERLARINPKLPESLFAFSQKLRKAG